MKKFYIVALLLLMPLASFGQKYLIVYDKEIYAHKSASMDSYVGTAFVMKNILAPTLPSNTYRFRDETWTISQVDEYIMLTKHKRNKKKIYNFITIYS